MLQETTYQEGFQSRVHASGGAYSDILSGPPSTPPVRLELLTRILSVAGVCVQLIVTLLPEFTSDVPNNSTATGTPIDQEKGEGREGGKREQILSVMEEGMQWCL